MINKDNVPGNYRWYLLLLVVVTNMLLGAIPMMEVESAWARVD